MRIFIQTSFNNIISLATGRRFKMVTILLLTANFIRFKLPHSQDENFYSKTEEFDLVVIIHLVVCNEYFKCKLRQHSIFPQHVSFKLW